MTNYAQEFLADNFPPSAGAGSRLSSYWMVRNSSGFSWDRDELNGRYVVLAVYLNDTYSLTALPANGPVAPGEFACFHATITLPLETGTLRLRAGLVHHNHAFFADHGAGSWETELTLYPNPYAAQEMEVANSLAANYSYFLPSGGMVTRRDGGRWPVFAREAKGARVQTEDGAEYIDYLMGWGSALLGHGHPRVVEAVGREIGGGATLSLPHMGEVETGKAVLAAFPNHKMIQFGKNGSDVCTLAVRMMRAHTGRRRILFWGYHGWQDWFAGRLGFGGTGVTMDLADLHAFEYGNIPRLRRYLDERGNEIAGIIMEPGAAVLGIDGPIPEVDGDFLRGVRDACNEHQILLAFDEIYTGFRHPGGSAQAATGVIPDITLLGKGLAAGYPLGALLTQKWLFESTAGRVMYGPTYKGERIALAACRAALSVYRETDVPAQLHAFGTALREAVLELPEASQLELRWAGPPYRQMAIVGAGSNWLRAIRRTLLLQELLRRGVLSYKGLFLPSAAHGPRELEETVAGFHGALQAVVQAGDAPEAVRFLEIPPPG